MKDENVIFETNMDQLSLSIGSQKSRVRFGDVDTIEMDSLETSVQVNRRDSQKGVNNKVSEGTGSLASEEDFFDDEYSEFKEFDVSYLSEVKKKQDYFYALKVQQICVQLCDYSVISTECFVFCRQRLKYQSQNEWIYLAVVFILSRK